MTDTLNINRDELISIRQHLHSIAEVSGEEKQTVAYIEEQLKALEPDQIVTGVAEYGIVATFDGKQSGPELLFRAELDGLPIPETINLSYGSKREGKSHKCGHDGHMAILLGLARQLSGKRPEQGKVHVMFQSAEETGQGAQWMLDDKKFDSFNPDFVFALHNLPGFPKGTVVLKDAVFASASTGFIARLEGQTSHAGHPEDGNSPAQAVSSMIDSLSVLPTRCVGLNRAALSTVIHARLGNVAFGTTPGSAEVMATLRAHQSEDLDRMVDTAQTISRGIAETWGLELETETVEEFRAVTNDEKANEIIRTVCRDSGLKITEMDEPFPWSEDFGRFTEKFTGALAGLGAGEKQPQLHSRNYDFPDEIIEEGITLFFGIVNHLLKK